MREGEEEEEEEEGEEEEKTKWKFSSAIFLIVSWINETLGVYYTLE